MSVIDDGRSPGHVLFTLDVNRICSWRVVLENRLAHNLIYLVDISIKCMVHTEALN